MHISPYCWQIRLPVKIEEISAASATDCGMPPHRASLAVTSVAEIGRRRREAPAYGMPTHIALSGEGNWVFLYPTPREQLNLSLTELASIVWPSLPNG